MFADFVANVLIHSTWRLWASFHYAVAAVCQARAFYCKITHREINTIEFSLCEKQHAHAYTEFLHQAILLGLLKQVKKAFNSEKKRFVYGKPAPLD